MRNHVDISVVVCTYNRATSLERALQSLLNLDRCNAFTFEVVVVDDGSVDGTATLLATLASEAAVPLVVVPGPGVGVAAARNAGVAAAVGNYIAFFDDDQIAECDWLLELWRLQTAVGADCTGGPRALLLETGNADALPLATRLILGEIRLEGNSRRYGRSDILCTGNMMVKRAVFERLGLFDESLREGGEDTDLFRRMRESGMECWFTPAALVHHLIPEYRLKQDYLYWTAVRGGRCYAQRDIREWGALRSLPIAAARLAHGIAIHGTQLIVAKGTGNKPEAVARRCMLARATAYARTIFFGAFSNRRQVRNTPAVEFRSERALFAESKHSEG